MGDGEVKHTRTYSWTALDSLGDALTKRSGLDFFRALRDGEAPDQPITATIGWRVVEADAGRIRLSLQPAEHLFHGGGVVHGGVLATLLDSVTSSALISQGEAGFMCRTVQLNVQFLRAVDKNTPLLFAEGAVVHRSRQLATAEGRVEDASGKVYARATATLLIVSPGGAPG